MKLNLALTTVVAATSHRHRREVTGEKQLEQEKRYFQLTDMMKHYNSDFDERKYWTYGCNCLILGDRPMSDPGYGPPVDALDTVCKAYKDCVKCARMEFGDMCIGEFVKYRYGYTNGEVQCKDKSRTCKRALCECDALLARSHNAKKDVFDIKYHMFWSTQHGHPMWDPKNDSSQCPRGGGGIYIPECCSNSKMTLPFILYNSHNKKCCNDGRVVPNDAQC